MRILKERGAKSGRERADIVLQNVGDQGSEDEVSDGQLVAHYKLLTLVSKSLID